MYETSIFFVTYSVRSCVQQDHKVVELPLADRVVDVIVRKKVTSIRRDLESLMSGLDLFQTLSACNCGSI